MAKSPEEILAALQKQKEDIDILLSSLEEAYSEAAVTEKHYKEIKTKNQKKLKELEGKIKIAEKKVKKTADKETKGKGKKPAAKKPTSVGEMLAAEQGSVPVSTPVGDEAPPLAPPGTAPTTPTPAPVPASSKPGGSVKFTGDDIKSMLSRFIKEIRPGGLEVLPKVEKMSVKLEKMQAFLDAVKDERSSRDENLRRLTEEIGEIRSSIGGLDRKISQHEIFVTDINTSIGDLKPQRFVKILKKEDMQLKMHDAKLQRLEDLNSVIIKRLTRVEEVLKKIGSLERVANFGSDIAKRLVEIEDSEKRMGRISDKIDSIFMELNKRLDEFMLYKAKQDTLDELSREMMKAIDSMNTKIEKYAEKEDLDLLRSTLEQKISATKTISGGAGASKEMMRLQNQKDEIEGLLGIMEEQFKKGEIKKDEYEKAKKINTERLDSITKKMQEQAAAPAETPAAPSTPAPAPATPAPATTEAAAPSKTPAADEKSKEKDKALKPEPGKPVPVVSPEPAPATPPKEKPKTTQAMTVDEEKKPEKPEKDGMVKDLEESMKVGELSKEAFDRIKRLLGRKKK